MKMEEVPQGDLRFFGAPSSRQKKAVKKSLPMLIKIPNDDPNFVRLVSLWHEILQRQYDPTKKYELLYRIIRIGNLIALLLPKLKQDDAIGLLKGCEDKTPVQKLNSEQQFGLFIVARNIAAHWAHIFYEPDISDFIEEFLAIAKEGICSPKFLLKLQQIGSESTASSGPEGLPVYLKNGSEAEITTKINKLFCQTAYFIIKAQNFIEKRDFQSACFALIAAGNCGRDFNRSKMNPVKNGSVMATVYDIRGDLAHIYENATYEEDAYNLIVKTKENFKDLLETLGKEAAALGLDYKIEAYFKMTEKLLDGSNSSPRPYNENRLNLFERKL
jgi:hypothetical protein